MIAERRLTSCLSCGLRPWPAENLKKQRSFLNRMCPLFFLQRGKVGEAIVSVNFSGVVRRKNIYI